MSQINTEPTNDIICPAHNYKSLINNNSVPYKSLYESITGTPLSLPFIYTGTSSVLYTSTFCALVLNNKSTNDISLIYKSLMFILNTISLTFSLFEEFITILILSPW